MNNHHFQIMNFGHALNHFLILIFPTAVLGLQHEWGMAYSELIQLGTLGVLAYGVGALPSGWLGDHWSRKGMMYLFFFGMGGASILTAFAQTPLQLSLGVALIGLFASIYHPVGLAIVFTTATKTGRAIAINGLAGNLGLACAALVTSFLTQSMGWQAAFLIPGVVCLAAGGIYHQVARGLDYLSDDADQQSVSTRERNASGNSAYIQEPVWLRLFISIAVIATFGGLVFQSLTTVLPKILQGTFDISLSAVGLLATTIFAVAALAQLVIGELLDKVEARTLLICVVSAQAAFLLMSAFSSAWWLVVCLIGLVFSMYAQIPINDWLIGKYASSQWRSRVYAVKYLLSFSTGPVAYWLIATIYANNGNFTYLYGLLASLMVLAVLAAYFMPKLNRTQQVACEQ
ncbi:MFS transporter [Photobacterium sanctipauli]|uniref:MFS transporter n=2 Tax=Photobacterium sanctipauli TaxID=1342794 RepID=A0A2T3P1B3_9GAMM|nr:MFS transporter [Photobacterium sanctipauli]